MAKVIIGLLIVAILALGGFAIYQSGPYVKSALEHARLFPELQKLIGDISHPNSTSSANLKPTSTPAITPVPTPSYEKSLTINDYLQTHLAIKSHSGPAYCAYKVLESSGQPPTIISIIALCQEYYTQANNKLPGTGIATPMRLHLTWDKDSFDITSSDIPQAGETFTTDIQKYFSSSASEQILNSTSYNSILKDLQQQVDTAVY